MAGQRLPSGVRIVLCCRSGIRAWRAAQLLRARAVHDIALIALGE
jgi:rhodanese-related sulfurtransferase